MPQLDLELGGDQRLFYTILGRGLEVWWGVREGEGEQRGPGRWKFQREEPPPPPARGHLGPVRECLTGPHLALSFFLFTGSRF